MKTTVAWGVMTMTDGTLGPDIVSITATNRGDRPVRVTGAGLDLQDGSGRQLHVMEPPPGADLPGTIAANDSGWTYVLLDEVKGRAIDPYEPLVGWVKLATNELVRSRARRIMARSTS